MNHTLQFPCDLISVSQMGKTETNYGVCAHHKSKAELGEEPSNPSTIPCSNNPEMCSYPCSCSGSKCSARGSTVTFRPSRKTEIALFLRFCSPHNCKFCEAIGGCGPASFLCWIIPQDVFIPFWAEDLFSFLISRDLAECGEYSSPYWYTTGFIHLPRREAWFPREFSSPGSVAHSMTNMASLGACEENHIY